MGTRAQGVRVCASEGARKRGCAHEGARKRGCAQARKAGRGACRDGVSAALALSPSASTRSFSAFSRLVSPTFLLPSCPCVLPPTPLLCLEAGAEPSLRCSSASAANPDLSPTSSSACRGADPNAAEAARRAPPVLPLSLPTPAIPPQPSLPPHPPLPTQPSPSTPPRREQSRGERGGGAPHGCRPRAPRRAATAPRAPRRAARGPWPSRPRA